MTQQKAWGIQGVPIGGAEDVANSLAARVVAIQAETDEVEHHLHNRERWFGKLGAQTATDWAENNLLPYRVISGNDTYGVGVNDEALILGTADTPVIAGMAKFDMHRMFIIDANSTTIWKLQLIYGAGTMAAALAAGQFSTFMVKIDAAAASTPAVPVEVMMPRLTCGTDQVWMRGWNATDNATLDFFVGLHEYVE